MRPDPVLKDAVIELLLEEAGDAARAVFYGAAGAMAPGPGFPPSGGGGGGFTMDPGQRGGTTVVINAAAVTAPEVIDLMGKYVQANGPLSRQWIGQ